MLAASLRVLERSPIRCSVPRSLIAAVARPTALLPDSQTPIRGQPGKGQRPTTANDGILISCVRGPNLSLSVPPKNKPIAADTPQTKKAVPYIGGIEPDDDGHHRA